MAINKWSTTCRLCLTQKESTIRDRSISDWQQKVESIFNLKIITKEHWPDSVCEDCDLFIDRIIEYRNTIVRNEEFLIEKEYEQTNEENTKNSINFDDFKDEDGHSSNDGVEFKEVLNVVPDSTGDKPKRKRGRPKNLAETSVSKEKKARTNLSEPVLSPEEMDNVIKQFMPLKCDLCGEEGFETILALHYHTKSKHEDYKRRLRIRCLFCNNIFDCRSKIYHHVIWHQNPSKFKCEECSKSFAEKTNYERHLKFKHSSIDQRQFKCDQCQKKFSKNSQLVYHMTTHVPESERSLQCPDCPKRFVLVTQLHDHIQSSHSEFKPFVCEICAKGFQFSSGLKNHILACHEKNLKLQCDLCSKFFPNPLYLKRHIKQVHTDQGKHQCDDCGHISPNKTALTCHWKRIHAPITNKFVCKFCDKVVKTKKGLVEHEATHTGARLYTCRFCPKEFNSGANKYKHQKEKHRKEWEEWNQQRQAGLI